jgi:hypothetical protein
VQHFKFEVSDEIAAAIEFAAKKQRIAAEDWLAQFISEALVNEDRFCTRAEFEEASKYILEKNHELYTCLAKDP